VSERAAVAAFILIPWRGALLVGGPVALRLIGKATPATIFLSVATQPISNA
jgi:hypothetical protein